MIFSNFWCIEALTSDHGKPFLELFLQKAFQHVENRKFPGQLAGYVSKSIQLGTEREGLSLKY
jgi:hypothetical protein